MSKLEPNWRFRVGAIAVASLMMIGWILAQAIFERSKGPSLIDDLRTGSLAEGDIRSIDILRFNPADGWPFQEAEYAARESINLSPGECTELISILRDASTEGVRHRNHPSNCYDGILRVETASGSRYYVFYNMMYYNNGYFTIVNANSRDLTNPNYGKRYENEALVDFLRRCDPWFDGRGWTE